MSEQAARPEYQYLVGLITEKESSFSKIQQTLSLSFRTCFGGDEKEILTLAQDRRVHGHAGACNKGRKVCQSTASGTICGKLGPHSRSEA
jgi:hypothetical protein